MIGVGMIHLFRVLLSGLALLAAAPTFAAVTASGATPAELQAPRGYRILAEVHQPGSRVVVRGRVCRTAGAAGHRPQTVRVLAPAGTGEERMLGWTGLSRSVPVRDTGCGFFSLTLHDGLPAGPFRIVAF